MFIISILKILVHSQSPNSTKKILNQLLSRIIKLLFSKCKMTISFVPTSPITKLHLEDILIIENSDAQEQIYTIDAIKAISKYELKYGTFSWLGMFKLIHLLMAFLLPITLANESNKGNIVFQHISDSLASSLTAYEIKLPCSVNQASCWFKKGRYKGQDKNQNKAQT